VAYEELLAATVAPERPNLSEAYCFLSATLLYRHRYTDVSALIRVLRRLSYIAKQRIRDRLLVAFSTNHLPAIRTKFDPPIRVTSVDRTGQD
jgi:hypothetical protein